MNQPDVLAHLFEAPPAKPRIGRAFIALLWRDTFVTGKEFLTFLAQVLVQPIFLLFVFGVVLEELGYTRDDYAEVLFPGVIALTAFITALQNIAFPLVVDLYYTKEIEDRLLAPIPIDLVAVEKIVFSTLRALIAVAVMFLLGSWMLGSASLSWSEGMALAGLLVFGTTVASTVGLALGTIVDGPKLGTAFTLIIAPLMFTGSTQFPWPSLEHLRWFQVLCALNPLTYLSEALRGVMFGDVPHIRLEICVIALLGFLAAFGAIGIRAFRWRALG